MQKIDFDAVRKIALTLPGVEEGTSYGAPALKLRGNLLACIPSNKSAEPDSLAVRIPFDRRDELIEAAPDVYYVKAHYIDYPWVLVRLPRIHRDALRDLLLMAHRFVSASSRAAPASGRLARPAAPAGTKRPPKPRARS